MRAFKKDWRKEEEFQKVKKRGILDAKIWKIGEIILEKSEKIENSKRKENLDDFGKSKKVWKIMKL